VVRRLVTIFKLEISLALEIFLVNSKRKSTNFFYSVFYKHTTGIYKIIKKLNIEMGFHML
jgi:hypothetical protein